LAPLGASLLFSATFRLQPVHRIPDHSSRHHAKRYPAPIVVKLLCCASIHAQSWIGSPVIVMHKPLQSMNQAIATARTLEQMERGRGFPAALAQSRIASRLGVGVGTFRNLVYQRVKSVDAALRDKLQALLIEQYTHEINRLNAELEIAIRADPRLDSDTRLAIEAHIAKARALLGGAAQGERMAPTGEGLARTIGEER
jgi:hypothetical protein